MILTLECLAAKEGDCLLLHWSNGASIHLAVIDGGPGRVYEDELEPRLHEIMQKRGLDKLTIELAMVSHVDNDHVVGIKKLFAGMQSEIENHTPPGERAFKAKRLWHNTFNDILGDSIDKYYKQFTASFTASTESGEADPDVVRKIEEEFKAKGLSADEAAHQAHDIALILAGHGESRALRDSHEFLFGRHEIAALNSPFKKDGKPTLITAERTPTPESVAGLTFKVVGPMEAQIVALQTEFDAFIEARGLTASNVLAAYSDIRAPNLSSIVCLVEAGGKKILLTGDARGDFIMQGLENAGLFEDGVLEVDILKVPHHGSNHNLDADFFEAIIADTYVISANGRYGNPDRESVEWIINSRDKNDRYDIVLTYPVADIDARCKRESNSWNRSRDSLQALFEKCEQDGFKFNVIAEDRPKIELGDQKIGW